MRDATHNKSLGSSHLSEMPSEHASETFQRPSMHVNDSQSGSERPKGAQQRGGRRGMVGEKKARGCSNPTALGTSMDWKCETAPP
eukprot:6652821-Prymnesium_polylepis.2